MPAPGSIKCVRGEFLGAVEHNVLMGVERGGMDLVWVKSVFWFVKYVDFYVIFL